MQKFARYIILLSLPAVLLASCEMLVDLTTDDSTDQIVYKIKPPFTELSLREDMDLELIESDDSVLIIDGPKVILDNLTIQNVEGKVEINFHKNGNWKYDKPMLQLKIPKIVPIKLYRFNNLFANDTLRTEVLSVFSDGTGDVHLMVNNQKVICNGTHISNFYVSGKTQQLNVSVSYSSSIKGADLKAENVTVKSFASNNQIVNPNKKLSCTIRQKGNIYYVNKPEELLVNISDDAKGRAIFDKNAK